MPRVNAITTTATSLALGDHLLGDPASGGASFKITASNTRKFMSPMANVLDHGALNNGTGNAQVGFAAAATALGSGGGTIWVPPGTYRFTATFDQPERVSVVGAGSAAVTINVDGAITGWRYKPASGVTNIRDFAAGFTIVGTASAVAGIQVSDCFGFELNDVTIRDCTAGVGLLLRNDAAWTESTNLNRVHVTNNSVGIRFQRNTGSTYDSFGYQRWNQVAVNVPASGIGIDVGQGGTCVAYRVVMNTVIAVGTSGTAVQVQAGSTLEGGGMMAGEKEAPATSTTGINNAGVVQWYGVFEMAGVHANTWGDTRLLMRSPVPEVAERFVENFAGTAIDKARWTTSADATLSGGRARLQATSTYAYDLRSTHLVNLVGSSIAAQVERAPAGADNTVETFFDLVDFYADHALTFLISGTNLTMRLRTSGTNSDTSITYSAVDHAWLRFAESGGNVTFQTSPDGLVWTTRRTVTPTWTPSNEQVAFQAAFWGTPGAGPFYAYVDNINAAPARPASQAVAYAATITPEPVLGEHIVVGTLTGNITVNTPTNTAAGLAMTLLFTQDATGGRTITLPAAWFFNWTPTTTANHKNSISLVYDGNSWIQTASATGLT